MSAVELQAAMTAGRLSSVEAVGVLVRRVEEIDSPDSPAALRAVLALSERAVDEARESDRRRASGSARGPLEGIPVLVKDNVESAGLPGSAGATSLRGRPARVDAPLVGRLRDAGAVILGATNLSEWANIRSSRSTGGWSAMGGLTANPWAFDRNAGGSSSGSGAAVAAGLAPLAVGTETDGSITCPASLNGVAGLKPTVGAVPTAGVVPISASQDSPGPIARTARDAELLYRALSAGGVAQRPGRAPTEPWTALRVAVARTWRTGHPGTDELFDACVDALRREGPDVVDVEPPVPDDQVDVDEMTVLLSELKDGLDAYLPTRGSGGPQNLAEVVAHERVNAAEELVWFGHDLFERALSLGGTANDAYREARARNLDWALRVVLEPALVDSEVLITPTYGPAWKSDLILGGHPAAAAPATTAAAIAGWPIATVPMGLVQGLPVGMGLIGRPGSEMTLLELGAAVEAPMRPSWLRPQRG